MGNLIQLSPFMAQPNAYTESGGGGVGAFLSILLAVILLILLGQHNTVHVVNHDKRESHPIRYGLGNR